MSTTSPDTASRTSDNARSSGERRRERPDIARLLSALPPHAMEAEMSLLGSIMIEPQVVGDIIQLVGEDDFFKPGHGAVFRQMVDLYNAHATIDIVQLNQALVDRGLLDMVGGVDYLVQLAESVPTATHAPEYARLVREKSTIRNLIDAAGEILRDAYESIDDPKEIVDAAERRIFNIAQKQEHVSAQSLAELIHVMIETLQAGGGDQGLRTGFYELDEMTGGLQPGEMVILAARPSMGKTAMALALAEQVAVAGDRGNPAPVAVFSLEMGRQQLVQRIVASRSGIDLKAIRRQMVSSEQYRRLFAACGDLQDAPIHIDDTPGLTVMQMRAKSRRLAARHGVKMIIIDYLQLMTAGGRAESRQVEVSEISRGVKALARELNVPVICLSQLNRAAEDRHGHRPRMSDLRESGSIEQDADVVSLLHREDYYRRDDDDYEPTNIAELIIAKQRNGPTGTVKMLWDPATTRFRNLSGIDEA